MAVSLLAAMSAAQAAAVVAVAAMSVAETAAVAVAALPMALERRVGLPLEQKAAESTQLVESPLAQGSGLD